MAWLRKYLFRFEFFNLSIVNADIRPCCVHPDDIRDEDP